MSDENKKKVALGTTLALLLGAGSYCLLAFGGGSDSDGLNSGVAGPKVVRAIRSDKSGEKEIRRHRPNDRDQPSGPKVRRDTRESEKRNKKRRPRGSKKVTKKEKERKPHA